MRIGHVVRQFAPAQGGLEEFVAQLAGQQVGSGHSVRVITCDRVFGNPAEKLLSVQRRAGVEVRRVPFFGSNRYPLAPQVLAQLRGLDVVHVHAVDFFFDFLAATRLLHRRPLVATVHGGFFHTQAYRQLKAAWFNTMTRTSCRAYRFVVANSISDFRTFSRVCEGGRLQLIENAVDLEKLADAASAVPRKGLVSIGRFSTNKRLDRLLDVFLVLVQRDAEWRLDICGTDSDWTLARLQDEIRRRGLDASVDVHARPDNDELRRISSASSFFVSASEYEGFGLAMVEAMSAGLVPIVHGNDAFAAFQEVHGGIRLADFSTPEDAASVIAKAWNEMQADPHPRAQVQRVASRFAWPEAAQRYELLYKLAVKGKTESGHSGTASP